MLLFIIRWILGYVSFDIIGKYPERFINIVTKNGLSIWNTKKSENVISADMLARDYKNIRVLCKKSLVKSKISDKHGLPFFVRNHKSRIGVVIGALLFCLIITFMSQFIWTIQVTGLKTISYTQLMETLEDNGLYIGTYKNDVSFQSIRRNTMLQIEDIGWMAINVTGSHASVEIKEKHKPVEVADISKPANVKAKSDGLIKSIDVRNGNSYFDKGSAVVKDQLIVSAVIEDQTGGVSLVRADAKVIADTIHQKSFVIKKQQQITSFSYCGEQKTAFAFNLDVPYKHTFADKSKCAAFVSTYNLSAFDSALPVGLKTTKLFEKTQKNVLIDKETSQALFEKESMLFSFFKLQDCTINREKIEKSENESEYRYLVTYMCTEDIAYQQEIDAKNLKILQQKKTETEN